MQLYYLSDSVNKYLHIENVSFDQHCDVLVIGLGSSGVFAALSAKGEGAEVIALERDDNIGGMSVRGYVDFYYYGYPGGSFEQIYKRENPLYIKGGHQSEARQIRAVRALREGGVTLFTGATVTGVYFDENRAIGVRALIGSEEKAIEARMIIDATSDGHIVRMCPAKTRLGRQLDGRTVPFTIRVQSIGANGEYKSDNSDSGYASQYDPENYSKRIIRARANLLEKIKDQEGHLLTVASQVGVREGLRIVGEQTLTYEDLLYRRGCKKPLFYAYSDLDKHGSDLALEEELYQNFWLISNLSTVALRIPVPMGAVVPKGLTGILTAGRCLSVDSYVSGAVRMNRDMYRLGECVGVAAAMAASADCNFLHVDYEAYLSRVNARGCFLGDPRLDRGFNGPKGDIPYEPLDENMTDEELICCLATDKPGPAIWASFLRSDVFSDTLAEVLKKAEARDTRYHTAIALGIKKDRRALPTLREIVQNRDAYFLRGCRRTNQLRASIAACLLGRIGDKEDINLLTPIIFDDAEYLREMYDAERNNEKNTVFHKMFTHAAAAYVKLARRHEINIQANLRERFMGENRMKVLRYMTKSPIDHSFPCEILDFFDTLIRMSESK